MADRREEVSVILVIAVICATWLLWRAGHPPKESVPPVTARFRVPCSVMPTSYIEPWDDGNWMLNVECAP